MSVNDMRDSSCPSPCTEQKTHSFGENSKPEQQCSIAKNVSFQIPPSENFCHEDKLSFEERSELWLTNIDLKLFKKDVKESIGMLRAYDEEVSALDPNKHCVRGLEAFYERTALPRTKARECQLLCILELQEEYRSIEEGGPGMNPRRRQKLFDAIEKLDAREVARAIRRAAEDRSVADQIHKEELERRNQHALKMEEDCKDKKGETILSFPEEPMMRVESAMTA